MPKLHGKWDPENKSQTKEDSFPNPSQNVKKTIISNGKTRVEAVQKPEHFVLMHGTKLCTHKKEM
jgi:hypothetical protein